MIQWFFSTLNPTWKTGLVYTGVISDYIVDDKLQKLFGNIMRGGPVSRMKKTKWNKKNVGIMMIHMEKVCHFLWKPLKFWVWRHRKKQKHSFEKTNLKHWSW